MTSIYIEREWLNELLGTEDDYFVVTSLDVREPIDGATGALGRNTIDGVFRISDGNDSVYLGVYASDIEGYEAEKSKLVVLRKALDTLIERMDFVVADGLWDLEGDEEAKGG